MFNKVRTRVNDGVKVCEIERIYIRCVHTPEKKEIKWQVNKKVRQHIVPASMFTKIAYMYTQIHIYI